jgi:subtilisin-like proprotein convertase family protein
VTIERHAVVFVALFSLPMAVWTGPAIAAEGLHKVIAPPGLVDERTPGVHLIADYDTYRLYRMTETALSSMPTLARERLTVADDMDEIRLDAHRLDTRSAVIKLPPLLSAGSTVGWALHLVQFVGPIKQAWLDQLAGAGIRPVQYIDSNAYLVWADASGRKTLDALAAEGTSLQYSAAYHPYYKLGPTLREPLSTARAEDRLVPVTIQILDHDGGRETQKRIESASVSIESHWDQVLSYRNVKATLPLSRIAEIAALPDVTWIGERLPITMNDEVQDQLVAAHFNGPRSGPSAPGYRAFLDAKGFPTDPGAYPIVGLSDDGAGNGSVANGAGDPTFTTLGDGVTSRVAFIQNCTANPKGNGVGGHGHLNMGIVGGYDEREGDPYQDADGYQRGMGVNPYGRMAMTKVFTNLGSFDIANCGGTDSGVIATSYNGGARISSNSWGCAGCAATYDSASQAYDARTRDALPATTGNQQFLFVFSAGNSGPGSGTVGTPGNGKNLITVGASENDRPGWVDGCGIGSAGADNAMDVISFSSRGPAPGGRRKPEVIAPGTHVQSTASTDPAYNGSGVCDPFLPFTQSTFAASSGTSHSAPAVAGVASLYHRWLQDHDLSAVPSPALMKAYMLTHTTYLTGVSGNDTLPSNAQGFGMPNLEMAFDATPRVLVDQSVVFDNSGDSWVFHGSVADAGKPVRIVMVYTDAPGALGTSPQVNDLNLRATVGGSTYNGNFFSGPFSVAGGLPDHANNSQAIFLPPGTSGAIVIDVDGFNVAGDGVPNAGDGTDQDFALVCYNCATCSGTITLDRPAYNCNASIGITLGDSDLAGAGVHAVTVRSTSETEAEFITLTESPAGSGVFVGAVPTTAAPAAHGDGAISVAHAGTVTIGYLDASACGDLDVTVEQTAPIDCVAPVISNVRATNVTGDGVALSWDTDEPASSEVTYGVAPAPPGVTAPILPGLTASHTYPLSGLASCTPYLYYVISTDPAGNATSDDGDGAFHAFTTVVNVLRTYPYAGPHVPIPDNNPVGATATIIVPDNEPIMDLNVTIGSLTHTYVGDLVLYVVAPDDTYVILSSARGGAGDNFVGTVFDDSAEAAIASGSAPYTGSFRPETPLSALNGRIAAGSWKLFAVDQVGQDIGTIDSWSLSFTYAPQECGPHVSYRTHTILSDYCPSGDGDGDALWEAGERVQFDITLDNDGSDTLTGVTATLTSTTPGMTFLHATAGYPDIAPFTEADSIEPHFIVELASGLVCGTTLAFQLAVDTDQGVFLGAFEQPVGDVKSSTTTVLFENFLGGIPATWTIVNGGFGGGTAATWTTTNPGHRAFSAPLVSPVAIVDSDAARNLAVQDEALITPAMNLSSGTQAFVDFDQFFHVYVGGLNEIADVDVRSSRTGGLWVNVLRQQGVSTANPDHRTIDITAQALGASNVQVRFHYYQASFEFFWQLDNVKVTYTSPPSCSQTVCTALPTSVKPVPDGAFGSAMTGSRADASGATIDVTWDVSTCLSTGYHLLFGDLVAVASYAIRGAACAIGTSGSYSWSGVPPGNLWFVLAADDGVAIEGSWGTGVGGAPRGGASASDLCGMAVKENTGSCP